MNAFFPAILLTYLQPFRQLFSKPCFDYFKAFIWAMMIIESKKTITNISYACFFLKKHIASYERFLSEYIWDMNQLTNILIRLIINVLKNKLYIHGAFLIAIDTTHKAKASKKMIGVQKWKKNDNQNNYITGHHWTIVGLISRFANRFICYPVMARMISGLNNPSHFVCSSEGVYPMTFWDTILAVILQARQFLENFNFRVVVDAYFANSTFINPMIDQGIHVVTRWRKDGVGWDAPQPHHGKRKRGRPKKYGIQYKLSNLFNTFTPEYTLVHIYGQLSHVALTTRDMYLRDIKQKVRVVVVDSNEDPIILVSTDLTLSPAEIIEIYSSRFSIEIAIRELKQHFGFGDYQSTTPLSIIRFVNLSCISLCLCSLMLFQQNVFKQNIFKQSIFNCLSHGLLQESEFKSEFSFTRVRRGLRRFILEHIIFHNSADNAELEKMAKQYEPIFRITT